MLYDPAPLNIPDDPGHRIEDPGYQISDGLGGGQDGRRLEQPPDGEAYLSSHSSATATTSSSHRREMQMVWFEGDERALYPAGEDGSTCTRDWV